MVTADHPVAGDRLSRSARNPRIAVLWDGLSGFLHSSLRALVAAGVDLRVFHREVAPSAPYDAEAITAGLDATGWTDLPDADAITAELTAFTPDAVIICSWNNGVYRKIGRRLQGRTLRIMSLSNQWFATPKQWAGVAASRFIIHPNYDAAFVCGERQATFARKLGFPVERLLWGLNSCDHPLYAAVANERKGALPKAFLFVGRLVPDKAIDVLAAGYKRYRQSVHDPWPLIVAGVGECERYLRDIEGVDLRGFVQPSALPGLFREAGCFVLPSRFEPWGVVVHEATAAGLPVVTTHVTGASTRLVLDGYNGVVISHDDAPALGNALRRVHDASEERRRAMGRGSENLALQYTPDRWAANVLDRIPELREQVGLPAVDWMVESGGRNG
jgi:glycosyltransferase involved in cell wall biosynthesis